MKLETLWQTALLLLGALALSQCASEPAFEKELLIGRWELQQGFRNGSPTESLDGLFFEFLEDGRLRTNMPSAAEASRYELLERQIKQVGGPEDIIYVVQELSDTSLLLTTELRKTNFRFILQKSSPEQE